jgi:hypothetical protein
MRTDKPIFQKSRSHPKIRGAIRMTWSRSYTRDPQILGAAFQNLIASANWRLRFMHPCYKYFLTTRTFQTWYCESSLAQYSVLWHRNVVTPATNSDTTHPATTDFYKRRMAALACHLQIRITSVFGCIYSTICFGYLYNFVHHVFRTSVNIKIVTLKSWVQKYLLVM